MALRITIAVRNTGGDQSSKIAWYAGGMGIE